VLKLERDLPLMLTRSSSNDISVGLSGSGDLKIEAECVAAGYDAVVVAITEFETIVETKSAKVEKRKRVSDS